MKNWKTGFALMASCLMLASCGSSEDDNNGGSGGSCSFTGNRCSADNTSVEQCVNGELKSSKCNAGCSAGECNKESTGETCSYSGSKCSGDGVYLLTCTNGDESKQECPNGCAYNKCKDKPNQGTTDVDTPKVTGLEPASGKAGTKVTIKGANLAKATKAYFGSTEVDVTASADSVVAVAPELEGSVTVGVIVDGKRLAAGTFTYLSASENDAEVDWCQVTYIESTRKPGEELEAYAQVYEDGVTGASGSHSGLQGQVGYMKADGNPSDTAAYTWVDAQRNNNFTGEASASNDEFMSVDIPLGTGKYRVAYRFSLDGANWLYCDMNGSQDGFSGNNAGSVTVAEEPEPEPAKVEWCRIMNGNTSIAAKVGAESESIYAQGYVPECTDYQNHCASLKAQVGVGSPALSSADAVASGYKWFDAKLNTGYDGSGGTKHDEFMGQVKTDAAGTYAIVYRMSVDNGETWTYCDTSDDVIFSVADAMTLTVTAEDQPDDPPQPEKKIEWCRIQSPDKLSGRVNQESAMIYGQVYVPGCTGAGTQCEGLKAEVGYGDPAAEVSTFTFASAKYNDSVDVGNNDEFMGTLKPTAAGDYAVVYRFSLDGENWTYCDYDDENGFKMDRAISMSISDKDKIVWCRTILDRADVQKGGSANAYGQVWVENCSEGDKQCESVVAEVGYGKEGDDAEDFTYTKAAYNEAVKTGNNDEYMAEVAPNALGDYRVAYRFSVDGEASWTYCDADDAAEFTPENMASLKVKDPIEWCQVFMNSPISVAKLDVATDKIYGQVFVSDCSATSKDAACEGLKAEIGYGTGDDVSTFKFETADYEKDVGYNDEFSKALIFDAVGEYKVVYAFSMADGNRKYCSLNGSKPFDLADAGTVKVVDPATIVPKVDWCRIVSDVPASMATGSEHKIYAQVHVDEDCTKAEGACEGLMGYVGYGKATDDPKDFKFTSATYYKDDWNNDEFVGTLIPETEGEYQVIFAFSMDGGKTKTYCTREDSSTFDQSKAPVVTVTNPPEPVINWCRVQYPKEIAAKQGETSDTVYGQVYVAGCTDGALKCASIMAEAGYGNGEDFSKYTWKAAVYNDLATETNNDEYAVSFAIGRDVVDTTYNVFYRFSLDNGETWTYCDFDDADGFNFNVANDANVAKMKVAAGDPIVGEPFVRGTDFSCGIDKWLATINTKKSSETAFYGQIWMPGCTEGAKCPKVVASHLHTIESVKAGREPIGTSDKWKVTDAAYNDSYSGTSNNEYMAKISPDQTGNYAYAFSFDLKHDPSDADEKEQRVFCFVDWQEYGFGSLSVTE